MPFSSSFSGAFVQALPVYITPMLAQEAFYAGELWAFDGVLRVGGKILIGLSGKPYAFASEATAATWCEYGRRVIEGERALVARLTPQVQAGWVARKREKLLTRAAAIYERAMLQKDTAKAAALVREALWCETKWGGYE